MAIISHTAVNNNIFMTIIELYIILKSYCNLYNICIGKYVTRLKFIYITESGS